MLGKKRLFVSEARWGAVAPTIEALTRRGLEAGIWILRSGAPWLDLAASFGGWERVYRRYRRWTLAGRWEALQQRLCSGRAPSPLLLIDSAIIKAHSHAAGVLMRLGGQSAQALGRSPGGFTTKLHALVTQGGRRLRYSLTGGEVHDVADRAYDCDGFIDHVRALGMDAIVPARVHR